MYGNGEFATVPAEEIPLGLTGSPKQHFAGRAVPPARLPSRDIETFSKFDEGDDGDITSAGVLPSQPSAAPGARPYALSAHSVEVGGNSGDSSEGSNDGGNFSGGRLGLTEAADRSSSATGGGIEEPDSSVRRVSIRIHYDEVGEPAADPTDSASLVRTMPAVDDGSLSNPDVGDATEAILSPILDRSAEVVPVEPSCSSADGGEIDTGSGEKGGTASPAPQIADSQPIVYSTDATAATDSTMPRAEAVGPEALTLQLSASMREISINDVASDGSISSGSSIDHIQWQPTSKYVAAAAGVHSLSLGSLDGDSSRNLDRFQVVGEAGDRSPGALLQKLGEGQDEGAAVKDSASAYVTPRIASEAGEPTEDGEKAETLAREGIQSPIDLPTDSRSNENSRLEMLVLKKDVYLKVKDWEEDRLLRSQKFHTILDPMVDDLVAAAHSAKESNLVTIAFLKERVKVAAECAARLKSSCVSLPKSLRHSSTAVSVSQTPHNLSNVETVRAEAERGSATVVALQPQPWIKALYRSTNKEADAWSSFAESLDTNIIQARLTGAADDYEKAMQLLLAKLRESRSRLKSQDRELRRAWFEFEKLFREVEKVQYSHVSQSATSAAAPSKPIRDVRDTWLAERRYLHGALTICHMQDSYLRLVAQGVSDAQQLETWRAGIVRDCLLAYMSKMRDTLGLVASSFGGAHAMIDPDDFVKARNRFLARQSGQEDPRPSTAASSDATPSVPVTSPSRVHLQTDPVSISSPEDSVPLARDLVKENADGFAAAAALLRSAEVPEPQLVIKKGLVRRHAGIWGKWSEGLLVLTWDRVLHMFRSFDDSQPSWSVFVPVVEVRLIEDKAGVKTVEVRDKKNLFGVLGSKSFFFRPYSPDDLESWLKCLTLASAADDRTYRLDGIESARSADQRVFDDYNDWVKRQLVVYPDVAHDEGEPPAGASDDALPEPSQEASPKASLTAVTDGAQSPAQVDTQPAASNGSVHVADDAPPALDKGVAPMSDESLRSAAAEPHEGG